MIPDPTERLCFRFFKKEDFQLILKLNSDPRVMTYFPEIKDTEAIELDFKRYIGYHRQYPGYGYWHTALKEGQQFVGFFIVKVLPESGETEIGYRLLPEYWGQGLATEGARAMVNYCFDILRVNRVVGVSHPENKASCRVLEKAGLEFQKQGRFYQVECAYYSLER